MKNEDIDLREGYLMRSKVVDRLGNATKAREYLIRLQRQGSIRQVNKNIFVTLDKTNGQPLLTAYEVAMQLSTDACISHLSALYLHGCAIKEPTTVFITASKKFQDLGYEEQIFHRMRKVGKTHLEERMGAVNISTYEQAVAECIHSFASNAMIKVYLSCLLGHGQLDNDALCVVLKQYKSGHFFQKCGYILEGLKQHLGIQESTLKFCQRRLPIAYRYMNFESGNVCHKRWRLYAKKYVGDYLTSLKNDKL